MEVWKWTVELIVLVVAFLVFDIGNGITEAHPVAGFAVRVIAICIMTFYIGAVRNGKL